LNGNLPLIQLGWHCASAGTQLAGPTKTDVAEIRHFAGLPSNRTIALIRHHVIDNVQTLTGLIVLLHCVFRRTWADAHICVENHSSLLLEQPESLMSTNADKDYGY
jgi:hypothetical protein